MSRAIDADALKEAIVSNVYPVTDDFNSRDYGMFWTSGIEIAIDEQPTIEPERKRGKWIRVYSRPDVFKYLGWTCSECGTQTGEEYAPQWFKYCPECGARMEACEQE